MVLQNSDKSHPAARGVERLFLPPSLPDCVSVALAPCVYMFD
jgi:hypothetical protein